MSGYGTEGVPREYFPLVNALGIEVGDQVRYRRPTAPMETSGVGIVRRVWFGVAEVVDVQLNDGRTTHLYPELGDEIEVVR